MCSLVCMGQHPGMWAPRGRVLRLRVGGKGARPRHTGAGGLVCERVCRRPPLPPHEIPTPWAPPTPPPRGPHQPAGVQGRSDAAQRVAQGVAQVEVRHLQVRGDNRRWASSKAPRRAWHWQRQVARRVQGMRTARAHLDAPVLGHEQVAGGEVAVQDGGLPRMQGVEALGSIDCLQRGFVLVSVGSLKAAQATWGEGWVRVRRWLPCLQTGRRSSRQAPMAGRWTSRGGRAGVGPNQPPIRTMLSRRGQDSCLATSGSALAFFRTSCTGSKSQQAQGS